MCWSVACSKWKYFLKTFTNKTKCTDIHRILWILRKYMFFMDDARPTLQQISWLWNCELCWSLPGVQAMDGSVSLTRINWRPLPKQQSTTSHEFYKQHYNEHLQRIHKKSSLITYNGVVFETLGKHHWNWQQNLGTYLYIVCKNSWKFNVKNVFYYMFSITRPKHKFPWQHRLMHVHSYLQWSSVIIHQLS